MRPKNVLAVVSAIEELYCSWLYSRRMDARYRILVVLLVTSLGYYSLVGGLSSLHITYLARQ